VTTRIEALPRDRKLGPARMAAQLAGEGVRISASGVYAVLVRLGINRLRDLDRPTGAQLRRPRYERETPGELIHVDVKKLGKIRSGGGWRAHGRGSAQDKANKAVQRRVGGRVGYDYVHVAIDDHTRLSYVEVLPGPRGRGHRAENADGPGAQAPGPSDQSENRFVAGAGFEPATSGL
jgi:hypothetical protein